MEFLSHPAFLVFIVSGGIAGLVWLVRLEGRINSLTSEVTKGKSDFEKEITQRDQDRKELQEKLDDTRTRFFEHAANAHVHHNAEAYGEFKVALERRMLGMEGTLKDMNLKLDQIRQHQ